MAGLSSIYRPRQRLAKVPDRVRVRHALGQRQPQEAHERQPVLDQIFRPLVRQRMARLKDQDLEHQHVIVGRPTALWRGRSSARRAPDRSGKSRNRRSRSTAPNRRPSRKAPSAAHRHRKIQAPRPSNGSPPETGKENHKITLTAPVFGGLHLSSAMSLPLFKSLDYSDTEIATVTKLFGFWVALRHVFQRLHHSQDRHDAEPAARHDRGIGFPSQPRLAIRKRRRPFLDLRRCGQHRRVRLRFRAGRADQLHVDAHRDGTCRQPIRASHLAMRFSRKHGFLYSKVRKATRPCQEIIWKSTVYAGFHLPI